MKIFAGFWYSLVMLVVGIGIITGAFVQYDYSQGWNNAPLFAKLGIPIVFFTFIGFWLLMLEDFLVNSSAKHKIIIGLSLFFLHWIAIFIYFWLVVYPRKK